MPYERFQPLANLGGGYGRGSGSAHIDRDGDGLVDGAVFWADLSGDGMVDTVGYARDTDGDGLVDVVRISRDVNGDGHLDTHAVAVDVDGDGRFDGYAISRDLDGDGRADVVTMGLDTDGDGRIDTVATGVDVDGDGRIDGMVFSRDTDGDGVADTYGYAIDRDGDGQFDAVVVGHDHDGDGVIDSASVGIDTNGDGRFDYVAHDYDGDGVIDEEVSVEDGGGGLSEFVEDSCFAAETRVATPYGLRPIASLKPGETVWSWDQLRHSRVRSTVTRVLWHPPRRVVRLRLAGGGLPVFVTRNHRLLSERGWCRVASLRVGERLLTPTGLQKVEVIEPVGGRVPVYNLHTTGMHNYFAEGVLAHNFTVLPWLRTWLHRHLIDISVGKTNSRVARGHVEASNRRRESSGDSFTCVPA